jgi:hypothetical protein
VLDRDRRQWDLLIAEDPHDLLEPRELDEDDVVVDTDGIHG